MVSAPLSYHSIALVLYAKTYQAPRQGMVSVYSRQCVFADAAGGVAAEPLSSCLPECKDIQLGEAEQLDRSESASSILFVLHARRALYASWAYNARLASPGEWHTHHG